MYGFGFSLDHSLLRSVDQTIGGWGVQVSDYLPATRLVDDQGVAVGVLLGWAIDPKEQRMLEGIEIVAKTGEELGCLHDRVIKPLIGTYLAILSVGQKTRIYMDGLGNLSVVFDPGRAIAGATAACIMDQAELGARFDKELYGKMEIAAEGWFPGGLTAHRGLERLMANHYLDCSTWHQVRHNSYEAVANSDGPVASHLGVIASEIDNCVAALLNAKREVAVGLTGGGDSRLLLAGLKPQKDRIGFYTVAPPSNPKSNFDLIRAHELSSKHELRHRTLPYVGASPDEMLEWDRRVGNCVITANRWQHPSVYPLEGEMCIGGLGGEVGRCFLWPDLARIPPITATTLVDMLKLPRAPVVIERVERWLADLPEVETTKLLDLAYIELRMSSWSSVQSYANPHSVIIHPLASFTSIEAMLRLAPEYRQNDGMISGFIEAYWPELLELPINRYGDWRDLKAPLAKITNPTKVYRKLRQMLRVR